MYCLSLTQPPWSRASPLRYWWDGGWTKTQKIHRPLNINISLIIHPYFLPGQVIPQPRQELPIQVPHLVKPIPWHEGRAEVVPFCPISHWWSLALQVGNQQWFLPSHRWATQVGTAGTTANIIQLPADCLMWPLYVLVCKCSILIIYLYCGSNQEFQSWTTTPLH